VEAEKRGDGLGSRLVGAAVEFARLEGFKRITLLTDGTNEGAIRFYERQGFVRSGMSVLRVWL
jgi:ribosomal protein S18 acetylase RimI-like enzyme